MDGRSLGLREAAPILGALGDATAEVILTGALGHPDALARAAVVSALGSVETPSALNTVTTSRANLGASINRFEQTISNLRVTVESLQTSRSRVQDADFAAETASLTRLQILQQSGTAVLAQANAIPQNVLSLLR